MALPAYTFSEIVWSMKPPGAMRRTFPDRTSSSFPAGPAFAERMRASGAFGSVRFDALTGGVAYVYVGDVRASA